MLCVMRRIHDANPSAAVHERLTVAHERDVYFANRAEAELLSMGFERAQLRWFDHHLCHAFAAFYCSPFQDALVVTFDGRGDCLSGTVYQAERATKNIVGVGGQPQGFKLLAVTTFIDSVAYLYSIVTQLLGFKPFHHEGKVTGLAAMGNSRRGEPDGTFAIFSKAVWLEQDTHSDSPCTGKPAWVIRTDTTGRYFKAFSTAKPAMLLKELELHSKEDIAAGVQDIVEFVICEYLIRNGFTGQRMCLAGGLHANVKLNQRIHELAGVETVYVFPHMGDGGIQIGAAMLASIGASVAPHPNALSSAVLKPWGHVFLGPDIDSHSVSGLVSKAQAQGVKVDHCTAAEFSSRVVDHIVAGVVVGLVYDRMEYGPRALGHRSILAEATDGTINDRLNDRLKRTEFMPFAPVTLSKHAERCYRGWKEDHAGARYMTVCYDTTQEFQAKCPAVVHVDGTARPQVIDESSGLYYDIVSAYVERTLIPALINTSFNAHGEPIVCTAEDAWRGFFEQDCCDVLALFPYIFVKYPHEGSTHKRLNGEPSSKRAKVECNGFSSLET
eukprot:gnl/MRDRNA2_/MRDRNA2_31520_c0_seq2.p1 gnl/MRDRNA2_/MRDRNA2_31520_c0~~gnl/MRDRNA2_/MRDRNA2_31520_c0_seq2.p1  ORF type:complete len:555 (-),score=104.91 gnl/MRDRNA2_/MRDRNA2_31520_c0_seq2:262-1926(-)